MLHLDHIVVRCPNLDTLENRLEIPEKFENMVLEKDGEDQIRSKEVLKIFKAERNRMEKG